MKINVSKRLKNMLLIEMKREISSQLNDKLFYYLKNIIDDESLANMHFNIEVQLLESILEDSWSLIRKMDFNDIRDSGNIISLYRLMIDLDKRLLPLFVYTIADSLYDNNEF